MALTTNQLVYGVFGIAAGGFTTAIEDFVTANGEDATADTLMNISYLNPTMLGMPLYSNTQYASVLVAHLMGGLNDTLEAAVAQIVVDYMAANPTLGRGAVAVDLIEALLAVPDGDRNFGDAKAAFLATVALADAYTGGSTNVSELAAVVSGDDPYAGQTIDLTVGLDVVAGTANADTFESNVVQNSLGQQVNTLGSGDELSGMGGSDVLNAKITAGSYVGGSATMPIQPETSSIETINLQAVWNDIGGIETVYVNAKDMLGVENISSVHSDASLVVQNMTTLDNDGSTRALSEMTVGMKYTGNADHDWDESNMAVYFDQDYLNPELTRGRASISIEVINEDAYDVDNTTPLAGVDFGAFYITVNGTSYDLANNTVLLGSNTINAQVAASGMETYADLLAYVTNAIDALKAAFPADAALQTLQAELGSNFLSDENRVGTTLLVSVDAGTAATPNTIEATEVFDVVAQEGVFLQPISESTVPNSNRYESAGQTPPDEGQILAIDVDLEKVGLAGDGGSLTIGSMFKDGTNVWSDTYAGKGIEQFNVTVYGDDSKPSSLSSMASTGNNLRTVNVVSDANQTGTYADLTIGNSNIVGVLGAENGSSNTDALKDVQTFDASGFNGDLTLFAGLSSEVVAKYLDRMDDDADPTADNDAFVYSGGAGNDTINLAINSENLAAAGTATREDMSVTINGGAGNDTIIQAVVNGAGGIAASGNWYVNQQINANLAINGGAGDDTIWTPGSGDVVINAGAGADTVYADNTGTDGAVLFNEGRAAWVFNSVNVAVGDLQSMTAATAATGVNLQLTVTFTNANGDAYSATVDVADSDGSLVDVSIGDLEINQAIKDAINNDAVLSKLLVAEDGPARTLTVSSLIDGDQATATLAVATSSTALNAAQTTAGASLITAGESTALGFAAAIGGGAAVALGRYDDDFVTDGGVVDGADSTATSDNHIEGSTGNDVIVLGTTVGASAALSSNDTLVYSGLANGTDSIVNFELVGNGIDSFDFSSYGAVEFREVAAIVESAAALSANALVVQKAAANVDGSYNLNLVNVGADGAWGGADDTVQLIGVVDFGQAIVLAAANVVI